MKKIHKLLSVAGLLLGAAHATLAADVMFYKSGEMPNPRDVARILAKQSQPAKPRTRGLSLVMDDAPAAAPAAAPASDEKEVAASPASASSLAVPVQFAFNSADILPAATAQLDAVAEGIKLAGPEVRVVIEGHTDGMGSDPYNLALSRRRAESVKTYLIQHHGIAAASLRAVGLGKTQPLNKATPFAPENRRVEFRAADA
jgi:outer membrane protein OmpA-like peptidoglycan-associated protein